MADFEPVSDHQPRPSPYAGCWVARINGKIVAHGGTPEQAMRAAKTSRHKEKPVIEFIPMVYPVKLPPLIEKISRVLPAEQPAYLVGGAVRDALLAHEAYDLDLVVPGDAIRAARLVANALEADFYPLDTERDNGRVIVSEENKRTLIDFAAFRGASLDADLRARDFTINALAIDIRTGETYDPLSGAADLRSGVIRACYPQAITDDPVRILRAVRLAAGLSMKIAPDTRAWMKSSAAALNKVSKERLRDELLKILGGSNAATAVRALDMLGVLSVILPELWAMKGQQQPQPHVHDVWAHTLSVLSHLENVLSALALEYDPESAADLFNGLMVWRLGRYRENIRQHYADQLVTDRSPRALLFLSALLHDVGKPHMQTESEHGQIRFWGHDAFGADLAGEVGSRLHLANDEIERVQAIVRHHMRLHFHTQRLAASEKPPSRRAVYRFFRDAGAAGIDLCLLALADTRATFEHTLTQKHWAASVEVSRQFMENWWEKPTESVSPPMLLNGHDLMKALSLQPGPKIGAILEAVREAQATGMLSVYEEAIDFAKKWLRDQSE